MRARCSRTNLIFKLSGVRLPVMQPHAHHQRILHIVHEFILSLNHGVHSLNYCMQIRTENPANPQSFSKSRLIHSTYSPHHLSQPSPPLEPL